MSAVVGRAPDGTPGRTATGARARSEKALDRAAAPERALPRRAILGSGALLLGGLLASCASLPSDGPVQAAPTATRSAETVVQNAALPTKGASPTDIVSGFLQACAAGSTDGFAAARAYLGARAAKTWDPYASALVFSAAEDSRVAAAGSSTVTVTGRLSAVIGAHGALTAQTGSRQVRFRMTQESGQWRIGSLDDGVILPQRALGQARTPLAIAFAAADGARLIPDLRWLPASRLAREAVAAVLAGPAGWLRPALRSSLPSGTALVGSPAVSGHAARVELSSPVLRASTTERGALAAEITAALRAVPGIDSVTVVAGGTELEATQALLVQRTGTGAVIGMVAGSAVQGIGARRRTLASTEVLGTLSASSPVLAADRSLEVLAGSSLLRVAHGAESATVLHSEDSGTMLPPVVDRHGWAWTAIGGELAAIGPQGLVVRPGASWARGAAVIALDLACDSERLAVLLAGSRRPAKAAVIVRGAEGRPTGIGPGEDLAVPSDGQARDIAWADETTVAVLVARSGATSIVSCSVGGDSSEEPGTADAVGIVADRIGTALLLVDSAGRGWQRSGATWRLIDPTLTDPTYPMP